jgi:hypothetical protein
LIVTEDSIAGAGRGAIDIPAAWRSLGLSAHVVLARFRTNSCDECTRPIRWWNRRVWVVNDERCIHLQCWSGRLFLKAYVRLVSDEIRHFAQFRGRSSDNDSADTELRELRAFARALHQRVERIEAQLQEAEALAAKMRIISVRTNGKPSTAAGGSR